MPYNKKRWFYLATATIILIFCGLIYGWSLFKIPFSQIYPGWTLPQLSMTFTISMIFFALGGFAAGQLSSKLQTRTTIIIAAILLLVGFLGVSRLDPDQPDSSLTLLYICYGVFGGGGVGLCYNVVVAATTKWFPDKPGLAIGIMLMGFGLGALLLGSVATKLIDTVGLFHTFFILGITTFIILALGALFLREPEAAKPSSSECRQEEGSTPLQMMRTKAFWLFFGWIIVCATAGLIIINSAASIALVFGAPAIIGMVVSICNGSGRVLIGAIFDRLGRKKTLLVNMCFQTTECLFLIIGAKTSSIAFIIIGLLFAGICYGGSAPITSTFINTQYGQKNFGVNLSVCNFAAIPAALLGPIISSRLIESSGGSYETTFYFIAVLTVVNFIAWFFLNKACDSAASVQNHARGLKGQYKQKEMAGKSM